MRVHLSRQVVETIRRLGEDGAELRRRIEDLKRNPYPADARTVDEETRRYEFFARVGTGGVWVAFEHSQDRGEALVRVLAIE